MVVYSALQPFIVEYGLFAIFIIVMLESAGLPLPGETALILGSVCAGMTGDLKIAEVILVASVGAIVGDNIGFMAGRYLGLPLVTKYGAKIGLNAQRLCFGQYMFVHHGAKIVFFGRFVAILRIFAAVLAGVNSYPWRTFLFYNAAGAISWAAVLGLGGYFFGDAMNRVAGPLGFFGLLGALTGIVFSWRMMRNHEKRFEERVMAREAMTSRVA